VRHAHEQQPGQQQEEDLFQTRAHAGENRPGDRKPQKAGNPGGMPRQVTGTSPSLATRPPLEFGFAQLECFIANLGPLPTPGE
jgi:hypothetical protein